MSNKT